MFTAHTIMLVTNMSEFIIAKRNILSMVMCVTADKDAQSIEDAANAMEHPGTQYGWIVAPQDQYIKCGGTKDTINGQGVCLSYSDRKHWILII